MFASVASAPSLRVMQATTSWSRRGSGTPTMRASFTGRAGAQLHLELGGRHVGAAGLDHLGAAALPVHEAVGVDGAGVAGVEEAVGVEAVLGRLAEVALHQRRALDGQLAGLARAERAAGVGVDDPQLVAGEQPAHALGHLARATRSTSGRRRTRTSRTGRSPPACARSVSPCTFGCRAKADLPYTQRERRQVGGGPVGVLLERAGLVGERVRLGDPLPLHQGQRLAGLEGLLHHPAPAGRQRGAHRGVEPGGPEHRERRPHPRLLVPPEDLRLHPELQRGGPVASGASPSAGWWCPS